MSTNAIRPVLMAHIPSTPTISSIHSINKLKKRKHEFQKG
jgi:hypothetical protein